MPSKEDAAVIAVSSYGGLFLSYLPLLQWQSIPFPAIVRTKRAAEQA